MLKVKTKIGPSSVHGTGLFADQFIPKGTITWSYDEGCDFTISESNLKQLPQLAQDFFLYYSYFDKKRNTYIMPIDFLKFINHSIISDKINISSTPDEDTADRDIQPGEELLCDYNKFDDTYFERIGLKIHELK